MILQKQNNNIEIENQNQQDLTDSKNPMILQSVQAIKSDTQLGNKRQKSNIDIDDGLVVTNKVTSRVKTDRIQKIWKEEYQKEDEAPKLHKKQPNLPTIVKRNSIAHEKKTIHMNVSEKAAQRIAQMMDKYKFSNTTRFIDGAQKVRAQLKQRLINVFLYGIQELRETTLQLNKPQKQLLIEVQNKELEKARKLALQTQIQLLKYYNRGLKGKIERAYRDRANIVMANLRDDGNFQLRKKVLSGVMSPYELATVKQIELYTQARREQIISKSRNLMAQNTLQVKQLVVQQQMVTLQKIKEQKQEVKLTPPPKSKYMNERLTDQLWDMIGQKQINRFYERLKSDLPVKQASYLVQSLNQVFETKFAL